MEAHHEAGWLSIGGGLSCSLLVVISISAVDDPAVDIVAVERLFAQVLSLLNPERCNSAAAVRRITAVAALVVQGVVQVALTVLNVLNTRLVFKVVVGDAANLVKAAIASVDDLMDVTHISSIVVVRGDVSVVEVINEVVLNRLNEVL